MGFETDSEKFLEDLEKDAAKDMPPFLKQKRPAKVKEIYSAIKRDHPDMPAEMKARIASRQGKKGQQHQGPPYKGSIKPWKEKKAASEAELHKVLETSFDYLDDVSKSKVRELIKERLDTNMYSVGKQRDLNSKIISAVEKEVFRTDSRRLAEKLMKSQEAWDKSGRTAEPLHSEYTKNLQPQLSKVENVPSFNPKPALEGYSAKAPAVEKALGSRLSWKVPAAIGGLALAGLGGTYLYNRFRGKEKASSVSVPAVEFFKTVSEGQKNTRMSELKGTRAGAMTGGVTGGALGALAGKGVSALAGGKGKLLAPAIGAAAGYLGGGQVGAPIGARVARRMATEENTKALQALLAKHRVPSEVKTASLLVTVGDATGRGLAKLAAFGVGIPIAESESGRGTISVGFPYGLGAHYGPATHGFPMPGGGQVQPTAGMTLLGPSLGLQYRGKEQIEAIKRRRKEKEKDEAKSKKASLRKLAEGVEFETGNNSVGKAIGQSTGPSEGVLETNHPTAYDKTASFIHRGREKFAGYINDMYQEKSAAGAQSFLSNPAVIGALIGGTAGAGIGALSVKDKEERLRAAIIGAGVGAATGGLAGGLSNHQYSNEARLALEEGLAIGQKGTDAVVEAATRHMKAMEEALKKAQGGIG